MSNVTKGKRILVSAFAFNLLQYVILAEPRENLGSHTYMVGKGEEF